jgi:hypothetical protein
MLTTVFTDLFVNVLQRDHCDSFKEPPNTVQYLIKKPPHILTISHRAFIKGAMVEDA